MQRWLPVAILVLVACGESTGPGDPPREISGTITVPAAMQAAPVVVGHMDLLFVLTGSEDTITNIGQISPVPDDPITVAGGATSRSYTYTLPTDPRTFGELMAFVDLDGDGSLDLPDEPARFPRKAIDGVEKVIASWGWFQFGDDPSTADYLVFDGETNVGLSIVGASGFNFEF